MHFGYTSYTTDMQLFSNANGPYLSDRFGLKSEMEVRWRPS